MPAINDSIVEQFELLGLSPEEISTQEGLSIEVVKAVLIQSSAEYRKKTQKEKQQGYTDTDLDRAYDVVRQTAFYSSDEVLAYKAAESIIDEKKGRKDVIKQLQNHPAVNAFTFNIQFQKAQEAIERAKNKIVNIVGEAISTTDNKSLAQ